MPVVLRRDGLRYLFFSNEGDPREPPHVHVRGGGKDAKIWLEPSVTLVESYGFTSGDLRRILNVVQENRTELLRAWHDYFGDGGSLR
jgi:hypothetical protein